jgi:hypothetical protein
VSQSFLKDQLKRIREMTEQMARVHDDAAELSRELGRDRDAATKRDPLAEVRDFRVYSSPNCDRDNHRLEERNREANESRSTRRHVARDSRRRRRK